jgi:RimJ/RimL family protein N-acetyltransferase
MIRIRPYIESDEKTIISWCTNEDVFYKWTAGILGEYPISAEKFKKTGEAMRFTALDEKEVVGFFTMRNPKDNLDELRFGFVIVDPEKRGKGIGKEMLKLGLDFAFDIYKAKKVTLGVFENNFPARACYKSIGFTETDGCETYVINGEEWACIEMECLNQIS